MDSSPDGTKLIPPIIHQIWYQGEENIPTKYDAFRASVRRLHPGWNVRVWGEREMREMVQQHFPTLLETYDAYPQMVQRVDAFKLVVLWVQGGVYLDMDMELVRRLDELIHPNDEFVVCGMEDEPFLAPLLHLVGMRMRINNAFIASMPKHPFLQEMIDALPAASVNRALLKMTALYVPQSTGPMFITEQVRKGSIKHSIRILPVETGLAQKESSYDTCFAKHHSRSTWSPMSDVVPRVLPMVLVALGALLLSYIVWRLATTHKTNLKKSSRQTR